MRQPKVGYWPYPQIIHKTGNACQTQILQLITNIRKLRIVVMLSVVMLSVFMLIVVMLSVFMLIVVMLSVVILSIVMLKAVMLIVVMLSAIMFSVVMLSVVTLNYFKLSVIVCYAECFHAECPIFILHSVSYFDCCAELLIC
jgi:hypothetical protein